MLRAWARGKVRGQQQSKRQKQIPAGGQCFGAANARLGQAESSGRNFCKVLEFEGQVPPPLD